MGHDARTALVLQGGGALGAYQAGAYARLHAQGCELDQIAGISIGAINAALIAGNPMDRRVDRLRRFWEIVTAATDWPLAQPSGALAAGIAALAGVPGFFAPRLGLDAFIAPHDPSSVGVYDTAPLRETLLQLVDFELLNDGPVRLAVSAVDVASGNVVWFDTASAKLGPEHIMASGALPPGFPPIKVDGRYYWDGGLVSNTPLSHIVATRADARPLTVWQVDLFSARGEPPASIWEVEAREKDIRFSSRTRMVTDHLRERHELARTLRESAHLLPNKLAAAPPIRALLSEAASGPLTLVHLIYRAKPAEIGARDYEFSRAAMQEHWAAGERDAARSLEHPDMAAHDPDSSGLTVFDLSEGLNNEEKRR